MSTAITALVRKAFLVAFVLFVASVGQGSVSAIGSKPSHPPQVGGSSCRKVGATREANGIKFRCVKAQGTQFWKRVQVLRPKTSSSSSIAPQSTTPLNLASLVPSPNCRLTDPNSLSQGISIGHPRNPLRLKSVGKIRIGVLFVDFPDAVATRSTESVFAIISPAAEDRFAHLSYGKADFDLVPVHKWIRMMNGSATYEMSRQTNTFIAHRRYISEVFDRARADLDGSLLDGFLVIANPDAGSFDFGPAFTQWLKDFVKTLGN